MHGVNYIVITSIQFFLFSFIVAGNGENLFELSPSGDILTAKHMTEAGAVYVLMIKAAHVLYPQRVDTVKVRV